MSAMAPFARVLVTGATGFVGQPLVAALATAYPDALIMRAATSLLDRPGSTEFHLDLRDADSVARALAAAQPDLVIHLAAQASVGKALADAGETWAINVGGTLALARAMRSLCPRASLFFTSTIEVYGQSFRDGAATEDTVRRPQSAYARSKAAAEDLIADVLGEEARVIIVRPSNQLGPSQARRFVVPSIAAQIPLVRSGQQQAIRVGNVEVARDFIDVRDAVDAYVGLIAEAHRLPARSVFNVSSGRTVTIGGLIEAFGTVAGMPLPIESAPALKRQNDIEIAAASPAKLQSQIGWRPRFGLSETLATILEASG